MDWTFFLQVQQHTGNGRRIPCKQLRHLRKHLLFFPQGRKCKLGGVIVPLHRFKLHPGGMSHRDTLPQQIQRDPTPARIFQHSTAFSAQNACRAAECRIDEQLAPAQTQQIFHRLCRAEPFQQCLYRVQPPEICAGQRSDLEMQRAFRRREPCLPCPDAYRVPCDHTARHPVCTKRCCQFRFRDAVLQGAHDPIRSQMLCQPGQRRRVCHLLCQQKDHVIASGHLLRCARLYRNCPLPQTRDACPAAVQCIHMLLIAGHKALHRPRCGSAPRQALFPAPRHRTPPPASPITGGGYGIRRPHQCSCRWCKQNRHRIPDARPCPDPPGCPSVQWGTAPRR